MTETNAGLESATDRLVDVDRNAAADLVREVAEADGTAPLSEDGQLALTHGRSGARHFVWRDAATGADDRTRAVLGYLYLSSADDAGDRTAELCVAPKARRRGIGRALVNAALDASSGALRIWAHGSLPGTSDFAALLGFAAVRDLRLLESVVTRDDAARFTPPPAPDGVTITTFRPGADEAAWLALNSRTFAHHPEQGAWTERDLAEREAESWFDPAGFFLARDTDGSAEAAGALLGFHWTKVHPAGEYGPGPVGEIYVLGVDPDAAGRGLGRLLALVGLQHLAQLGLNTVILYVDGDNVPAVRLYASLGFRDRTIDTLYERGGAG
ncbi:MAG: mycothiol synthase [Actinocrinis sp.]